MVPNITGKPLLFGRCPIWWAPLTWIFGWRYFLLIFVSLFPGGTSPIKNHPFVIRCGSFSKHQTSISKLNTRLVVIFSWLWNVSYRCNKSLWTAEFGICFQKTCHGVYHPLESDPPLTQGTNGSLDPIAHMVWLKFFQWSLELPCKTNFWSGKVSQFFEQHNFWVFRWTQTSLFLGLPGKGTQKFYKKSGWVED